MSKGIGFGKRAGTKEQSRAEMFERSSDVRKQGVANFEEMDLIEAERAADGKREARIPVKDITKLKDSDGEFRNPRDLPWSFEEFAQVEWPGLDLTLDDAEAKIREMGESGALPYWNELSDRRRERCVARLVGLHDLAADIQAVRQVQPIVVERGIGSTFVLIAGERRVLAHLYGRMFSILADVYDRELSENDRVRIMHSENKKDDLTTAEKLKSNKMVFDQETDRRGSRPSVRETAKLLGMKHAQAQRYKKVMESDLYPEVVAQLADGQLRSMRDAYNWVLERENGKLQTETAVKSNGPRPLRGARAYGMAYRREASYRGFSVLLKMLRDGSEPDFLDDGDLEYLEELDLDTRDGLANAWVYINERIDQHLGFEGGDGEQG